MLDTAGLREADRADALREAMRTAGVPANVTPMQDSGVHSRLNLWQVDERGSTLMHRVGTGLRLERTTRQVRVADPDRVGVTLLPAGKWTFHQFRADHSAARVPGLVLVYQGAAYDHRRWSYGTTIAVNMERSVLDVPVDTVIRASQNLSAATPLHALVCGYLVNLAATARHAPDSLAHAAAATTHLMRAIICAAAGDARERDALAASLFERITLYIDAHLTEPDLGPDRIAAAHHISVRHLYNVWRGADGVEISLANWIIARRLAAARARLADAAWAHLTVAAVGRAFGFTDPTHFARRFRAAYGETPREWRARH